MLIPLWLPWTLVAALALPLAIHLATRRWLRRNGYVQPGAGLAVVWGGSGLLVALVVACALSIDRYQVTQPELDEALGRAAAVVGPATDSDFASRVATVAEAGLGRELALEIVETEARSTPSVHTASYHVRAAYAGGRGPMVCLERWTRPDLSNGQTEASLALKPGECG